MSDMKYNRITEGVIWKELILFSLPIMLGTLFQQLYNAVDVVVVGHFVGTEALASVGGSSGSILNLVVGFFVGLSSGATVIVSRFFGGREEKQLSRAISTSIAFSVIGGVVLFVVGFAVTPAVLQLLKTPGELIPNCTLYLRIYFCGIVFVFLYNMGSGILRAMGDSRWPLLYLIICCVINILMDLLLVVVFHLGVAGVAIATVTAQAVSAALTMRALFTLKEEYRLRPSQIRLHGEMLGTILFVGLPAAIQSILNALSGMIMTSAVNSLGTYAVAGNTAYAKLDAIYWMIVGAFSVSIATFVGQNFGAGKYDRVRKSVRVCLLIDLCVCGILSLFFFTLSKYLLYMFTSDEAVIQQALDVMRAIAPYYAIVPFYDIFTSALRGAGDVIVPMIINIIGTCGVRILWVVFVGQRIGTVYAIIISCPVSWAVTAVLMVAYYLLRRNKIGSSRQQVAIY